MRMPYDYNTVQLPTETVENARNYYGEKELIRTYKVIALYKGEFTNPITVRCWMGRSSSASVVHASLWYNTTRALGAKYGSGYGTAGGYGYDKVSGAIADAFDSAHIELGKSFGGCGDVCTHIALKALAKKCGYRKFTIVEA